MEKIIVHSSTDDLLSVQFDPYCEVPHHTLPVYPAHPANQSGSG